MNRLIIIGNGFDLAHGMPTRYYDFVRWYLVSIFSEVKVNKPYSDEAIDVYRTTWGMYQEGHLLAFIKEDPVNTVYLNSLLNNDGVSLKEHARLPYWLEFKFSFLKRVLLIFSDKNWVDIESEFYRSLLEVARIKDESEREREVDNLNKSLEFLKDKLAEYLATLTIPEIREEIAHILGSNIDYTDILAGDAREEIPLNNLVLNFNYTSTIKKYLSHLKAWKSTMKFKNIFIHGELKQNQNPLIFGFGDEMDENYRLLERFNYNGFLDNMKSFGYFKTQNYHSLVRFIEETDYQIFVMGHSCGLSDRVMLNMIFEHHHCQSIKLYYHQKEKTNNFKVLTQDISRHFNKKNELRKKIVPFDKSTSLLGNKPHH